jgi:tRNA 2-thiocytidine biosynthesis protein TtcA
MTTHLNEESGGTTIIRLTLRAAESALVAHAKHEAFPIIPCSLCGSQENLMRQEMPTLLNQLTPDNPWTRGDLRTASSNIDRSHFLLQETDAHGETPVTLPP